jgi:hypothetical protein
MSNDLNPDNPSNDEASEPERSRIGKFIQTYHSFLSSFVIGAAGLIATSIWQFRQAEIAGRQASAQQKVAETQAENNWKIEKAKILAQNLQTLATQGAGNVEQRYGVLLSLTRGNILDPELAVSYALELGRDNPEYMRSVLSNTEGKDYWRLARAFEPTCQQRYGVTKPIELCAADKLAERSAAIAGMFADEITAAFTQGKWGPVAMLADEHQVQALAVRLSWLFAPALNSWYEKRAWNDIARFESNSEGAKLVSALVLAAARTGELVSHDEAERLNNFHAQRRKWLTQYLVANSCDSECKSKLVDVMLTNYSEAQGDYDLPMRSLLQQSSSHASPAFSTLHSRLLWCQVDSDDLAQLRDRVLVPETSDLLAKSGSQRSQSESPEDLIDLLALVPPPKEPKALDAWKSLIAAIEKGHNGALQKRLNDRRAVAARDRSSPPPAMRKISMCGESNVPTPASTK